MTDRHEPHARSTATDVTPVPESKLNQLEARITVVLHRKNSQHAARTEVTAAPIERQGGPGPHRPGYGPSLPCCRWHCQ